MKINRILPYLLRSEVSEEKTEQKGQKSFEEILQEERGKLVRLIAEVKAFEDIKQFYTKCHPRFLDDTFQEE